MKKAPITLLIMVVVVLNGPSMGEEKQADPSERSDEEWIADLASDDVRLNATLAFLRLWHRPPVELLEEALNSPDYQQRQMAAGLLRSAEAYQPSVRLLEVTVEALRDDVHPRDRVRGTWTPPVNASDAVPFLVKHAEVAKEYLLAALDSDDPQQRFLCAYILGMNGIKDELPTVASILIPHLRDNDIFQDACMACSALYRLGEDVRPYLLEAIPNADGQQEKTIQLILADLEGPPTSSEGRAERRRLQDISISVYDPALQYEVYEIDFRSYKKYVDKALRR